ncbi:MAG: hypothetical protein A2830_03010 [Candidatus Taylorbacteria bacterium RIFCSPHIGHO2_01_FULL_44_110]|uniref:Uncharacterized protein n=1 Tax=Candidatus Taylorbacteria bacterium RIFCSPHIGHO2_12_FULL_45_16 TaxID=1802315 RepID=A0A1G2MXU2_9BACT|nr:MAG: hypothetical protein A2830_03010 [Candidatus Taylorbacteria bacterium RIFCSPHIGHO2_01_FULL_44_110]OHA28648.1 MAG: hypothetical protein A3F51_04005 [Candidatus Taylorbacteria bacterium RIFCSPHIGHO2_12_FULL_45_16]OHA32927.1 MAG: hypothetical protein A3A23_00840 [Candidatus Taylorbacteria bacterium RIFCSPLOWO2_01_FULL_45_59]OHA38691.1 MAG: hypothetical protein A3I98_01920 [Candidatus Taylorbacteria bacterium RIFCSPLOWO2_02_FULL_45_10b]
MVLYSKDSSNGFRRLRRRGNHPAKKFRICGGAAPIKTAEEPVKNIGSNHIFNFGGKKIFNSMKRRNVFIALLIILIIGVAGYFVFIKNQPSTSLIGNNPPPVTSNQPVVPSSTKEEKILEITLEVSAPFSIAKLSILEDGSALYSEKMDGKPEQRGIYEEVDIETRDRQMKKFVELVRKNNFFSMKDRPYKESDPLDGSSYTLTIKIRPAGPPGLVDAAVHTVSCYEFSCEPGFLEIQKEMRTYFKSYWNKEVLEVGV